MLTKPCERIKFFRTLRGWTQEKMAEKLQMSVIGYGNIERGDTDVTLSKLQEIVKVLGIELQELFDGHGKVIINLGEHSIGENAINVGNNNEYKVSQTQKELEHELEKSRLIVEQQRKELSLVYQEIEHLKEIISLLKQSK